MDSFTEFVTARVVIVAPVMALIQLGGTPPSLSTISCSTVFPLNWSVNLG